MSRAKPASEAELLAVNGVGEVKLQRYGRAFLDAIADA
jgi:superfamily II DNA helicase RecQ